MVIRTKLWANIKLEGVEFNKTDTETARQIREISVYTPFDMVARYDGRKFVEVSCSCGWNYSSNNEETLLSVSKLHNHNANREYSLTLRAFKRGALKYQRAFSILKQQGMSESKAEDWLDRVSNA